MEFDTSIDFEYFLIQVLTFCVGAFIVLVLYGNFFNNYNLDKVKIYETNIEKPVVKFGYGLFNRLVSVELSISRDYIK